MATTPRKGLFTLPAEIRNVIFELALVQEEDGELASRYGPLLDLGRALPSPKPLLTCRQWESEMRAIYYGANKFFVQDIARLREWFETLRPCIVPMIRRIAIASHYGPVDFVISKWDRKMHRRLRLDHMHLSRLVNGGCHMQGGLKPEAVVFRMGNAWQKGLEEPWEYTDKTMFDFGMCRSVDEDGSNGRQEMLSENEYKEVLESCKSRQELFERQEALKKA